MSLDEALPALAHELVLGDAAVLHEDLDGLRAAQPHLVLLLADPVARGPLLDDERGDAPCPCPVSVTAVITSVPATAPLVIQVLAPLRTQ